jgi:uncharacterized protein (TIGR03435 family)
MCAFVLVFGLSVTAQRPMPAFAVASIERNTSGDPRTELGFVTSRRFRAVNETVRRLVGEAYGTPRALPAFRIVNGPSWIDADRFDVDARADVDVSPNDQHAMLRALLAERFKSIAHMEMRVLPVFALQLARRDGVVGPQLRRSDVDCAALSVAAMPPPPAGNGRPVSCVMQFGFGRLAANRLTMAELATIALSRYAGRPVLDEAGLIGPFQWTLAWTPDNLPSRAPGTPADQPLTVNGVSIDPNRPSLATALHEQLGLTLASTEAPVDVLVIDHIDHPTEN